jgi:hypothetical protein
VPAAPFSFTKGLQTLRVEAGIWDEREPFSFSGMVTPDSMREDLLFDMEDDPSQLRPIVDPAIERRMIALMKRLMKENDAPDEQFERMGLTGDKTRDSA